MKEINKPILKNVKNFWIKNYLKYIRKFLNKIKVKKSGCWEWIGGFYKDGYGAFYVMNKMVKSHRFSYRIFRGKFDESLFICHSCDNKKCVNPNHLWKGTLQENHKDMMLKGRNQKGDNHWARKNPELIKRGKNHWNKTNKKAFSKFRKNMSIRMRGENSPNSKLNESKVRKIRDMGKAGYKHREIAELFKVNTSLITQIINRNRWKHVE